MLHPARGAELRSRYTGLLTAAGTAASRAADRQHGGTHLRKEKLRADDARAADIIKNWLRTRSTIEFLGTWEALYNPGFKVVEFDHFRKEAGLPTFTLSVSNWIEKTGAIGLVSKVGRYGGTYAHKDIAFEFCGAISPVFKLYLIKEYQRLKEQESSPLLEDWKVKRILSKVNYEIHTDAVRDFIVPQLMEESQIKFAYTSEADMLNLALFHYTAKQSHSLTEMFQYSFSKTNF